MKPFQTLPAMVQHIIDTYRSSYALNYRVKGAWQPMSTEVFIETIRRLALGLHALGLKKGESVGLIARSSPHWLIVDLATMIAGGVSVPIFSHFSEANFRHVVKDCEVTTLFVIDADQWAAVSRYQTLFKRVVTLNVDVSAESAKVMDFNDLLSMGDELSKSCPELYASLRDAVQPDDIATITYTGSGQGVPKGVLLTHRGFVSQIAGSKARFPLKPGKDRILSMLPLAHVFERMLMYYYISDGGQVYFVDDLRHLQLFFDEVKPTHFATVPLILEKIYSRIKRHIAKMRWPARKWAEWMFRLAHIKCPRICHHLFLPIADKLAFRKIRKVLGGQVRTVIVGGAPFDEQLCQFYLNVGVPVYQGYGLTEASPVITTNYLHNNKPGTVGKPFPDVEVKISDEGEILARGPNVMKGYHKAPEGAEVYIDEQGWLHTGDLGKLDEHGFLTVLGREKEIFKTSGGKMVSPVPIEKALALEPLFDHGVVIAHGRKHPACLLFPNGTFVSDLKVKRQQEQLDDDDFFDTAYMKKKVSAVIDRVNSNLNDWEKIRAWRVVCEKLTVENGDLMPTLSVNRPVIEAKYSQIIETMY